MGVTFEDNSENCKNAIKASALAFLYEIGGEIRSQTQRNSRRRTGRTAGTYEYMVDENELAVHVGSNDVNAIWEEFGTGEHSIKGGRKGYWVFVDNGGAPQAVKGGKRYTKEEAKKVVAIMRKKGLNAYYTNGKTANRPLYKAFTATEGKIQSVAERCFSNIGGGSSSGGGKDWSLKNYINDIKSKTDKLETAMDDPSSLAPQPHMPSIPHAKAPKLPKAKTPKILKNLK